MQRKEFNSLNNFKALPRQYAILASFRRTLSLSDTGKEFKLSRERVRQILEKLADPQYIAFREDRKTHWASRFCTVCKRSLAIAKAANKDTCGACSTYNSKYHSGRTKRYLLKGDSCPSCHVKWDDMSAARKKMARGLCRHCYTKLDDYREYHRKYYHKPIQKAKRKIRNRKYYLANKDSLTTYLKDYRKKNRAKINAYFREYRLRKRSLLTAQE